MELNTKWVEQIKSILHFIYGAWIGEKGQPIPIVYSKKHNKTARFNDLLKKGGYVRGNK